MTEEATVAEAVVPTRGRRKIIVAVATLFAVVGAAVAFVARDDPRPAPLALVAGGQGGVLAERLAGPGAASDAAPAVYPGYPGIEYRVTGELPDLGGKAPAWRIVTRDLDRTTATQMASALGLTGELQRLHGGWMLEVAGGSFSVFPAGDGWSVNFYRTPGDAAGGGSLSSAEAERAARTLLTRMGALEGEWVAQTFETEIGLPYDCVDATERREEAGMLAGPTGDDTPPSEAKTQVESGGADTPVSAGTTPSCPPPSPAVKAHSVSFFPLLGGVRADWNGWTVTVRPDGSPEYLYGTWATFERAGDYPLRSVVAALEELRSTGDGPRTLMTGTPGIEPASDMAVAPDAGTAVIDPAFPCDGEPGCAPPAVTVTITGVERSLVAAPVLVDGGHRLYLVPAYRFIGTFEDGSPYETSVIALHPDFIAPATDTPSGARDDTTEPVPAPDVRIGGGEPGFGGDPDPIRGEPD